MKGSNRRSFLGGLAGLAGLARSSWAKVRQAAGLLDPAQRQRAALQIRQNAALYQAGQPLPGQISNGDETNLPNYVASFTKGLAHTQSGEVEPGAYETLLHALSTGSFADFENIDRGSGMKFVDPESAFAYQLEGADSHRLACPPAPGFSSTVAAAEMVELYWQALTRDVAFSDYGGSTLITAAAKDLGALSSFQGPKAPDGTISADTIFRGTAPGCLDGPYLSQFLWKPVPMNSTWINQLYRVPAAGVDYLASYPEWIVLQSGLPPYRDPDFDPSPRYIVNGRGLAEWVHYDFLYQAYHFAALILMNMTPESILDTNPYWSPTNPYKSSRVQTGFATFGGPHVCCMLGRVTAAALQAAWYQKWCVHRRLRPEEFGGRVHQTLTGGVSYPISSELLKSAALADIFQANGTYLLPQTYPEGCPLHPSYPQGHGTVAGACATILKAFFDENGLITDCVMPSSDGLALMPCDLALTVGGEINKLAFNIAMGRDFAGIHYRSDAMAGFRLGEDVAIAMLQDLVSTLTEDFSGFQFTRMDGTAVQITKRASIS